MEDFVTFEIVKKLKEKGFSLEKTEIYGKFDSDGLFHPQLYFNYIETMDYDEIDAPTISQVLKWLREEKKIYVAIYYVPIIESVNNSVIKKSQDFYYPTIQKIGDFESTIHTNGNDCFSSYEEAALAGIEYVLDNLI